MIQIDAALSFLPLLGVEFEERNLAHTGIDSSHARRAIIISGPFFCRAVRELETVFRTWDRGTLFVHQPDLDPRLFGFRVRTDHSIACLFGPWVCDDAPRWRRAHHK